jgi:ArsR family transcriptional regulator
MGDNMECDNKALKELVSNKLMDDEQAQLLSEFFKLYSDQTRIRIIELLSCDEVCVHDIASVLDMSQSSISHQLKTLRQHRIVKTRKEGKHIFYSLNDDHIMQIFKNGLDHINE